MYFVEFKASAAKALARLSEPIGSRLRAAIDTLAQDPFGPNPRARALRGSRFFRLRVGDWRVIYGLDRERLVVLVVKIGARGDVYD